MSKYIVYGGTPLKGEITLSGAKNVAMKAIVAALLTDDKVTIKNIPLISSVTGTADIIKPLNAKINFFDDHRVEIISKSVNNYKIPLDVVSYRTSTMILGPLLHRFGEAIVPNPSGCRIGERPIDRHIEGLKALGAEIEYKEGFYHAKAKELRGTTYKFLKNTHTGTETLIIASVLAKGTTILENSSEEPEVDDLIGLLNSMGAKIKRTGDRVIKIEGVRNLHGVDYSIMPDRNEAVTFAIATYITRGDIFIKKFNKKSIQAFLEKLELVGANFSIENGGIRFFDGGEYKKTDITTSPFPGFMTDWQAPWALLATRCVGISTIHETVFESRFAYVSELKKMGAKIEFFSPKIANPETFYNFNWKDRDPDSHQAIKIYGPAKLHNAVVGVDDLRAGATLVLASLGANGESTIHGIEHIDRGYEDFDKKLSSIGANIKRINE